MAEKTESQTTLETVVGGLDIFKFGTADVVGSPGAPSPEPATPAPATGDHPGEAIREGGSERAEGGSEKKEPPAPPAPRFKTHDEAERGYRELQGKTTKAEQDAAEARRAADAAKTEADAAKAKLAEAEVRERRAAEATTAAERQTAVDIAVEAYATERRAAALKEIGALDPDDPEHDAKVAAIWGKVDGAVLRFNRNPVGKDGKPIGRAEVGSVKAEGETTPTAIPAPPAAPAAAPVKPAAAETAPDAAAEKRKTDVINYIDGKARAAGIKPESDELWWGVSRSTPAEDAQGQKLTIDQQIDWAINRYNERMAEITATARQRSELPLGGGGHIPGGPGGGPAAPAEGPASLDAAISKANEARRL